MTDLAQLYALYSDRARSFNQWQRALYLNFIIIYFGANEMILHEAGDVFCILSSQAIFNALSTTETSHIFSINVSLTFRVYLFK